MQRRGRGRGGHHAMIEAWPAVAGAWVGWGGVGCTHAGLNTDDGCHPKVEGLPVAKELAFLLEGITLRGPLQQPQAHTAATGRRADTSLV